MTYKAGLVYDNYKENTYLGPLSLSALADTLTEAAAGAAVVIAAVHSTDAATARFFFVVFRVAVVLVVVIEELVHCVDEPSSGCDQVAVDTKNDSFGDDDVEHLLQICLG